MRISPISAGRNLSFKAINYIKSDYCNDDDFKVAKKNITVVARTAPIDSLSDAGLLLAYADMPCSNYDVDVLVQALNSAIVVLPKIDVKQKIKYNSSYELFQTKQTVAKDDNWRIKLNPNWLEYSGLYQKNEDPLCDNVKLDSETHEYLFNRIC